MFVSAFFVLQSFSLPNLIGLVLLFVYVAFCSSIAKRYSALKGKESCSFTETVSVEKRIRRIAFIPLFIDYSYSFDFEGTLYRGVYTRHWSKKGGGLELSQHQSVKFLVSKPEVNCLAIDDNLGLSKSLAVAFAGFALLFFYFFYFK